MDDDSSASESRRLRQLATAAVFLGLTAFSGAAQPAPRMLPAVPDTDGSLRCQIPDLLDYAGIPKAPEDWTFLPLFDHGSWHGFALPPADRPALRGAFTGPLLLSSGRWAGPYQGLLSLFDRDTGKRLPLDEAAHEAGSCPGLLKQGLQLGSLEIQTSLWHASARTTLIRARITNRGATHAALRAVWSGESFEGGEMTLSEGGSLLLATDGGALRFQAEDPVEWELTPEREWRMALREPVALDSGDSQEVRLAISVAIEGEDLPSLEATSDLLSGAPSSYAANEARWEGYLRALSRGRLPSDPRRVLAVKASQTLIGNWRSPAGRLRHDGLFPSSNVAYFNGFWAWDSWKHAGALVEFAPELAREQVRAMFAHQNDRGMIADVVYLAPGEDNWRDTKPPLAGWAIERIYDVTDDLAFVRELYPALVRYHRFWYTDRDHDHDGMCEYGSTDGTAIAARWESGMDNAVRFDDIEMLENGPEAWSMDQESVDLNSYLYREKRALERLSLALGNESESLRWAAEAQRLAVRIREQAFDPDSGWFYDTTLDGLRIVPVQGPEGWTALWTGVATEAQAAAVRRTLLDPSRFRTFVPFPTVSRADPGFSDGYWRGLVWLDQAYFALEGLRRYGFHDDARALSWQLFEHLDGALSRGRPLYETYHPLTGAGRNSAHFSWSAAHLLLLALRAEEAPQEEAEASPDGILDR